MIYLLPSPRVQAGKQPDGIFLKVWSHFWKSATKPKGMGIKCPGQNSCLICNSRKIALGTNDPQLHVRANNWAKSRSHYWYQVVCLSHPQQHKTDSEGKIRPLILQAGWSLHNAIGSIIKVHGLNKIVDPQNGRPIILIKKKTGMETMDVEYSAVNADPMPLPVQAYPILQNMFCLQDLVVMPNQDEMVAAVQDMGMPVPNGMLNTVGTAPAGGNSTPSAASWAPTGQLAPAYAPPMPAPMPAPVFAPVAIPMANNGSQMPVTSGYTMQGVTPMASAPVVNDQPHLLTPPLAEFLPGGKERCFTHFNAQDSGCGSCPEWIRQQCFSNTKQAPTQDAVFDALQAQLMAGK